jgi:DNA-binding beta-propeller fold protein YncE
MDAGRILVVCKGERSLQIIDLERGRSTGAVVSSGDCPHEVAASSDGTVGYLPVYSDVGVGAPGSDGRAVDIIDLVRAKRMATVKLTFASRPHLPLWGPDGLLYVSTELDESISVFDPRTMRLVRRLATGAAQSHMFAFSPDGRTIAVANVRPGTVSVLDLGRGVLRGIVDVTATINRISFDPGSGLAFTADQESPRLAVVDTEALRVDGWIEVPGIAFGTAVTIDRRHLVVALRSTCQIGIIDLSTREVVAAIDVPAHPQAIVVHPDGRHAYSACDDSDVVVEVDLLERSVSRLIPTGRNPDGIAWSPRPG